MYYGGSLSTDFKVGTAWYNVEFDATTTYDVDGNEVSGYDRPQDVPVEQVYTLNTGTGTGSVKDDGVSSYHTNLEIVGDRDITFTGPIQLGQVAGDSASPFNIDFADFNGNVINMTVDHFEQLANDGSIVGNGDAVVNISIAADADNTVGFEA